MSRADVIAARLLARRPKTRHRRHTCGPCGIEGHRADSDACPMKTPTRKRRAKVESNAERMAKRRRGLRRKGMCNICHHAKGEMRNGRRLTRCKDCGEVEAIKAKARRAQAKASARTAAA